MNENEIMEARYRHGNISRREHRFLLGRMINRVEERGPTVQDDDVMGSYACYWCGNQAPDHETDCIWLDIQEIYGEQR